MESMKGMMDKFQMKQLVDKAMDKAKVYVDKAKVFINNTQLEMKVLEATNQDPWGPHGTAMQEITAASLNPEGLQQILGVVDERLKETGQNWRMVYKTLLLLEFMCKQGPMCVVEQLLGGRLKQLEALREFEYKDPAGRDRGINVRQRTSALIALISDPARLTEERERSARNSGKFSSVSSAQMRAQSNSIGSAATASSDGGSSGAAAGGAPNGSSSGRNSSSRCSSGSSSGRGTMDDQVEGMTSTSGGWSADAAVEATRLRISQLKAADGPDADGQAAGGAAESGESECQVPTGSIDFACPNMFLEGGSLIDPPKPQRAPRKLSDVKVNPAISALFAKPGMLAPPPGSSCRVSSGGGAQTKLCVGSCCGAKEGSCSGATPAVGSGEVLEAAASAGAVGPGVGDEWDAFMVARAPAAATRKDPFADLGTF